MRRDRAALGIRGENLAAGHLESLGYEIVERNYRCAHGEIDMVAREAGDLVFVEVKTRSGGGAFASPSEAVDSRKRRKLALAGECYLIERDLAEVDCRFDVVEVYLRAGRPATVEVIKGAFSADGG